MGKLIRLGATALSMIGILVMILCVQAAILFEAVHPKKAENN